MRVFRWHPVRMMSLFLPTQIPSFSRIRRCWQRTFARSTARRLDFPSGVAISGIVKRPTFRLSRLHVRRSQSQGRHFSRAQTGRSRHFDDQPNRKTFGLIKIDTSSTPDLIVLYKYVGDYKYPIVTKSFFWHKNGCFKNVTENENRAYFRAEIFSSRYSFPVLFWFYLIWLWAVIWVIYSLWTEFFYSSHCPFLLLAFCSRTSVLRGATLETGHLPRQKKI